MELNELKPNVSYVINGDIDDIIDPIWQQFVDHILSVGSADHMNFAMKTITSTGSDTFKELRDAEFGRKLKQTADFYRTANMKLSAQAAINRARGILREGDETGSDSKRNSVRRSNRRSTVDGPSHGTTLLSMQNRRDTSDASISDSRFARRCNTLSGMERHKKRENSPITRSNSENLNKDNANSLQSIEGKSRGTSEELTEITCNSPNRRRVSISPSPTKRRTQNGEKLTTRITSARDILKEMDVNTSEENGEANDVTSCDTNQPIEKENEGKRNPGTHSWRTLKNDMQDKRLESIQEQDGGWALLVGSNGYVTDAERSRQRLYAKYIGGSETLWHEGLKTYEQYKHVIEDTANRERQTTKLNSYRKSRGVTTPKSRSSPRHRPKTAVIDNKSNGLENEVKHRPSTCPPFRPGTSKQKTASSKSTFEERRVEAEINQAKTVRSRNDFEQL